MNQSILKPSRNTTIVSRLAVLIFAGLLATTPALAKKPDSPGNGKDKQHEQSGKSDDQHGHSQGSNSSHDSDGVEINFHFGDKQRTVTRDYYKKEFSRGHCPPGLAKKHNGCLPPGQAKKWTRGRPLPRDVVYYDLPHGLLVELGSPPAGHKFVRVAADILLIAVGTSMVVDAIEDLDRM